MTNVPTCALWYWSHGTLVVLVYDEEWEAVSMAIAIADEDTGSIAGVQYADGRYVPRDQWGALREEEDRRYAQMVAETRAEASKPQPAQRRVAPPFEAKGLTVVVPSDAPAWLGRQENQ